MDAIADRRLELRKWRWWSWHRLAVIESIAIVAGELLFSRTEPRVSILRGDPVGEKAAEASRTAFRKRSGRRWVEEVTNGASGAGMGSSRGGEGVKRNVERIRVIVCEGLMCGWSGLKR